MGNWEQPHSPAQESLRLKPYTLRRSLPGMQAAGQVIALGALGEDGVNVGVVVKWTLEVTVFQHRPSLLYLYLLVCQLVINLSEVRFR